MHTATILIVALIATTALAIVQGDEFPDRERHVRDEAIIKPLKVGDQMNEFDHTIKSDDETTTTTTEHIIQCKTRETVGRCRYANDPDRCYVVPILYPIPELSIYNGRFVFDKLHDAIRDCAAVNRVITVIGSDMIDYLGHNAYNEEYQIANWTIEVDNSHLDN